MKEIQVDPKTPLVIKDIITQKHQCEKEMAEAILNSFDNSKDKAVLGVLRGIVANSIEDIDDIITAKGREAFDAAYKKDAKNYGFVSAKGLSTPERFLNYIRDSANVFDNMNTDECGCMIRFYGEVIEAGKKIGGAAESQAIKDKLKVLEDLKGTYQNPEGDLALKPVWKKSSQETGKEVAKGPEALRNRVMATSELLDWEHTPSPAEMAKYEARQKAIKAIRLTRSAVERQLAATGGGIGVWVQEDEDLLARMNKVFGLIHGATISGTTTDTLFFLNRMSLVDQWMGNRQPKGPEWLQAQYEGWDYKTYKRSCIKTIVAPTGLDPLYYLIPIATIVGKGHHSLLEVAVPLVLNKKLNYIVGKYTRLLADRPDRDASDASDILNVLRRYEDDDRNKRILIYYHENKEIAGYLLFDKGEQVWDDLAMTNQNLLNRFKNFSTHPTRANILSLHPDLSRLALESQGQNRAGTGPSQDFLNRRAMFERQIPRPQRQ